MTLILSKNKTSITNHSLNALAEEICRVYPTALIVASDYVAKDAHVAVRSGPAYDPGRAHEAVTEMAVVAATPDQSFDMRRIVWKSASKQRLRG